MLHHLLPGTETPSCISVPGRWHVRIGLCTARARAAAGPTGSSGVARLATEADLEGVRKGIALIAVQGFHLHRALEVTSTHSRASTVSRLLCAVQRCAGQSRRPEGA
jgi:hypothetical protein